MASTANSAGIDPAYAALLNDPTGGKESEYKAGREALPRFDRYAVKIDDVDGRINPGFVAGHLAATVVVGPKGTPGKKVFFDISLLPWLFKKVKDEGTGQMVNVPMAPQEKAVAVEAFNLDLNRVVKRLKLATSRPAAVTETGIREWLAPAKGATIIVALRVKPSEEFGDSNVLSSMKSVAGPDEPHLDDNKKADGKTMLQFAQEEARKFDERSEKKAGKSVGQTAKGFAAQK